MKIKSLSLAARITLNLHSLNNEGTEGNQQQTRMVHVVDAAGNRQVVNAVSGDMFKHILVGHLTPLLAEAGEPLSSGARALNPDRVNVDPDFVSFSAGDHSDTEVLTQLLSSCAITDLAGTLVTAGNRSVARKSVVEFGWVVGVPDKTVTEQYFHVKYSPEGREGAAGGDTVAGKQAIFHRPASSGVYALVCNLELDRIGLNDITRAHVVSEESRLKRAHELLHALAATLLRPAGAQRNTQNPHITACQGTIATSTCSFPAPLISPLADDFAAQMNGVREALNRMKSGAIEVTEFASLTSATEKLGELATQLGN